MTFQKNRVNAVNHSNITLFNVLYENKSISIQKYYLYNLDRSLNKECLSWYLNIIIVRGRLKKKIVSISSSLSLKIKKKLSMEKRQQREEMEFMRILAKLWN